MDETIKKNRGSDIKMDIEECKETYEMLKKGKQFVANVDKDFFLKFAETVLSELEKKDKEIEKLKKDNKELLRKLRNRVKEVNKLTKYSLYKKEFSTLNKQLEKKDKVINEMAKKIVGFIGTCPNDNEYTLLDIDCEKVCEDNMKQCWVEYFTNKVEREGK